MKGYKVFNSGWTCNPNGKPFQYAIGQIYEEDVKLSVCNRGFHFCEKAADCFNYYEFNSENKVAEVEALGDVITEGDKSCTNKIHIVREISWEELLTIVNTGKGCSGLRNSGNWNSGDGNSGDGNSGCFNTDNHTVLIFDKPSSMTLSQWRSSDAYYLLNQIDFRPTDWIWSSDMTDEEKKAHPECETTGGYLKENDTKDCCLEWWNGLSINQKCIIQNIPNFESDKFYQITGIRV